MFEVNVPAWLLARGEVTSTAKLVYALLNNLRRDEGKDEFEAESFLRALSVEESDLLDAMHELSGHGLLEYGEREGIAGSYHFKVRLHGWMGYVDGKGRGSAYPFEVCFWFARRKAHRGQRVEDIRSLAAWMHRTGGRDGAIREALDSEYRDDKAA